MHVVAGDRYIWAAIDPVDDPYSHVIQKARLGFVSRAACR